jgi:hypothetical protein
VILFAQNDMNTSIPSSKIVVTQPTPEESKGLQDFWNVYEEHRQEVTAELIRRAEEFPEFSFILKNSSLQPTPEQRQANIERQHRAIYQNEWEPYLENLWSQGKLYAEAGLSFQAWFKLVSIFRKLVRPYLLDTFGETPERLLASR